MAAIQVKGRVRNGVIELAEPVDVPDGTEVLVTVPEVNPGRPRSCHSPCTLRSACGRTGKTWPIARPGSNSSVRSGGNGSTGRGID